MPCNLETWWEEVTTRRGGLAQGALIAASWPYRLGLEANLALYRWRLKPRTRPALPVVSVGNLSLGGAGKSTTVVYLARRLQALGLRPAVVTRGYRGQATAGAVLISTGEELLAGPETGDEAVMLARLLPGVPVAVGKRREAVITVLAARTPAQVVLLDDGFQYFRMQRLLDLVLIDASRASPRERLFPAGRLREPWDHLRRAGGVWLTHVDQATPTGLEELEAMVERHSPLGPSVHTRHRLSVLRSPHGEHLSSAALAGQRVLALSGLGNPRSFELSLAQAGAEVVPCRFPDHHPYSPGDLLTINDRIEDNQPHLVVTTEKDAVKLVRLAMTAKQDFRRDLWVAECELELLRGAEQVETQLGCIAAAVRPE